MKGEGREGGGRKRERGERKQVNRAGQREGKIERQTISIGIRMNVRGGVGLTHIRRLLQAGPEVCIRKD